MSGPRCNILFLSPTWPLGQVFGGQMRALHVGRALQHLGKVTFLVVGSNADDATAAKASAKEFGIEPPVRECPAPTRGPAQRLRWAVDPTYLNMHGVVASDADRGRIMNDFENYDLIWVMNCRTSNILQVWRWPHAHLDVDDLPSTNSEDRMRRAMMQRLNWNARRWMLRRRERLLPRRFTTLSVCSEADSVYLGHDRVHVIPNGFARPSAEPRRAISPQAPRLGFIGLYSYAPNLDGVRWFLREVWPLVQEAMPGVRFRLVGKDTDGPLTPTDNGVDALGWVADPSEEIATWSAMIVPIRFGGGTRIKLADAFSRKCPVVATRFGARGYDIESGRQALLADDPLGFAAACIELLRNENRARSIAENAWQDFLARWTWDTITPKVWTAAEDCLRRSAKAELCRRANQLTQGTGRT